jgi:hypothetical protein
MRFSDVAILALHAERRSNELHGGEDLIRGDALEDLDILELLFRKLGNG